MATTTTSSTSSSTVVEGENISGGFTIMTHVIPSQSAPAGTGFKLPAAAPVTSSSNSWRTLLRGEPKALGTVQIMIGVMIFLFGVLSTIYAQSSIVFSGITYWGSFIYISSGALLVTSARQAHPCVDKGSLILNIFSTLTAGSCIVLLSIDLWLPRHLPDCPYRPRHNYDYYNGHYGYVDPYYRRYGYNDPYDCTEVTQYLRQTRGIIGVMIVFSLLEFITSIYSSAFKCSTPCCDNLTAVLLVNPSQISTISPIYENLETH